MNLFSGTTLFFNSSGLPNEGLQILTIGNLRPQDGDLPKVGAARIAASFSTKLSLCSSRMPMRVILPGRSPG